MHKVLVNRLVKLAQDKSVVRRLDRPDMTIAVDQDIKHSLTKVMRPSAYYPPTKSEGYSFGLVRPSVHTFCLSGTISQYLLVRFDSFLVQMISTMDSRYPISLVKIDSLTLELLPLFSICNYKEKPILTFFCVMIFTFHQSYYI